MSHQQLKARLYALAIEQIKDANRGVAFTSKSSAMRDLNRARGLK